MKTIDATRIKQALNKLQAARAKSCDADMDLITHFAEHGMKSMLGSTTPLDHERLELEVAYAEVSRHPEILKAMMADCLRRLNRYSDRRKWIDRIQSKYGISGLAPAVTTLGDRVIHHEWEDDTLRLIESDLPQLRQWKAVLCEAWLDYVILNGLTIYKHIDNGWEEAQTAHVTAYLPLFDWCKVWESVSYTSPSVMRKQGYDEVRAKAKHADDVKHWEVSLAFGNGIEGDMNPDIDDYWFCACNRRPYH